MHQTHESFLAQKRFAGLDGLRCIAIIAVVWHHSVEYEGPLAIVSRGYLGVDLFFVLSGFLITTLLIREKTKHKRISLKNFWARRFLRLMPAYYTMLFSLALAYYVFKPGDPDTALYFESLPYYVFYFSNWIDPGANNMSPLWSLATEEQFYLLWPLLQALLAPIILAVTWVVFFVVNQLINFGVLDAAMLELVGLDPKNHPSILETTFTPILLGVGAAYLMNSRKGYELLSKTIGFAHRDLVMMVLLAALLCMPIADISGFPRLMIHLLMTGWLISIVMSPDGAVTRGLSLKPIEFIGAISYGMYLYHMWCIHAVRTAVGHDTFENSWIAFLLSLAVTVVFSVGSYYALERPFLNLRTKFRKS